MTRVDDQLAEGGFESATYLLGSVVYVLCLNSDVVYIGRSTEIVARLLKHRAQGRIAFNRVWVKSIPRDLASAEEVKLIKTFSPPLNIASAMKVRRRTRAEIRAASNDLLVELGWRIRRRA
jgi:hypothetical protein